MGMIMLTAPTNSFGFLGGSTLSATVVNGLNSASGNTANSAFSGAPTPGHETSLNVSATTPTPLTNLKVGVSYDYTDGFPAKDNYADVWTLYLMCQATEKLKLNARLDYTEGSDGTYYNRAGGPRQNRLGAATLTADYALWANVISRAEFRWDHSMSGDKPYGGTGATPIPPANTGVNRNAVSLALNLIYKF